MLHQQAHIIIQLIMFVDAVSVIFAGYAARYLCQYWCDRQELVADTNFAVFVVVVMVVNNYVLNRIGLYKDSKPKSRWTLIKSIFKGVTADCVILLAILFIIKEFRYSQSFLVSFYLITLFCLCIARLVFDTFFNFFSKNGFNTRKILVIGDKHRCEAIVDAFEKQLSWGHQVTCVQPSNQPGLYLLPEKLTDLHQILRETEVDEVVFAVDRTTSLDLDVYINMCRKMGISMRILPGLWSPGMSTMRVELCQGIPLISVFADNFNAASLLYKRVLDIVGGLVGSVIFLILYPFVATAIKLDSPGPVLFKQERVGKNGRLFKLIKFRTMYADAEEQKKELMATNEMNGPIFKVQSDPRITRVGRFLRRTTIDEIPQFVNVLKSEMSLVGTRPPLPEEVELYDMRHLKRISAKPGMTGLWQVSGRNKIKDFEKIVELDCDYLDHWRFLDDIKILLKTLVVVSMRRGAI